MPCRSWFQSNTFVPSSSDIDALLSKIDAVLRELNAQIASRNPFPNIDAVKKWEEEINRLTGRKRASAAPSPATPAVPTPPAAPTPASATSAAPAVPATASEPKAPIVMRDGKVDPEEWKKKSDEDKRSIWVTLETAFKELRRLNEDSLRIGQCYFRCFAILLTFIVLIYLSLHTDRIKEWQVISQPSLTTERAAWAWEQARTIELLLADLKQKQKVQEQQASTNDKGTGETRDRIKNGIKQLKDFSAGRDCSGTGKDCKLLFPFETAQLLGTVSAEFELDDPTVQATYQAFLKRLKADLESFSTAYFWTVQPWRWLELVFWAWMGCMVGLLFYIAGNLGQGIFKVEESAMLWTEIIIAPLVVLVVFFLFHLTGITDFIPNEASLTVNLGIAFIFGFAIRRTVGLLDIIKKRFFPDPSPGSTSPGS